MSNKTLLILLCIAVSMCIGQYLSLTFCDYRDMVSFKQRNHSAARNWQHYLSNQDSFKHVEIFESTMIGTWVGFALPMRYMITGETAREVGKGIQHRHELGYWRKYQTTECGDSTCLIEGAFDLHKDLHLKWNGMYWTGRVEDIFRDTTYVFETNGRDIKTTFKNLIAIGANQ